ncbi:hypothetical protein AAVH_19415 [Aphelenchoides avenae]|nr:hypothetical protein AAVH_19415 [Aphelenchus avenae]
MFKVIALIVLLSVVLVSAHDGDLHVAACVRIIRGICQGGILGGNLACTQACIAQGGIGVGVCANLSPLDLGASVCVCLSA